MSLLRCTFQPQKVTSRKVGKLWNSHSICKKTWEQTKRVLFPFVGPNHSEFIHSLQILWGKYDSSEI
jgi:hypothetical protein